MKVLLQQSQEKFSCILNHPLPVQSFWLRCDERLNVFYGGSRLLIFQEIIFLLQFMESSDSQDAEAKNNSVTFSM